MSALHILGMVEMVGGLLFLAWLAVDVPREVRRQSGEES